MGFAPPPPVAPLPSGPPAGFGRPVRPPIQNVQLRSAAPPPFHPPTPRIEFPIAPGGEAPDYPDGSTQPGEMEIPPGQEGGYFPPGYGEPDPTPSFPSGSEFDWINDLLMQAIRGR